MDYLYIVNAFKQQQQFMLHQQQFQQQTTDTLSFQQQLDNSNMSNSLIWQPWRELQQAAVHHHLHQQQQQKLHCKKENRLSSKELPTTAWRRERRLRTVEYHHSHHYPPPGSTANSVRASSPSLSPPTNAHVQHSAISSGSVSIAKTNMPCNAHHISIMMAAAASMHPLSESVNHPSSTSPPPHSHLSGQIHLDQITHTQGLQHINSIQNDEAPLDMSFGNLKQRHSPPPPYREPLPGSQFASSLARPSVITQAPPKRDIRDSALVTNRESDNRSCESIDEHFRRSLGNDYFSLFSKRSPASQSTNSPSPQPHNPRPTSAHMSSVSPTLPLSTGISALPPQSTLTQSELIAPPAYPVNLLSGGHQQNAQQAYQYQPLASLKANNVLLSPATVAVQMKIPTDSNLPPLPLVVRPNSLQNHQNAHSLQKSLSQTANTPLTSPPSPAPSPCSKLGNTTQTSSLNTSGSTAASSLPLQQQSSAVTVTLSHLASVDNSPSSSPHHSPTTLKVPVSNQLPNLPAIMRIKTEPGLQNLKSNNPTPPASPTLTTSNNINSNTTSNFTSTSSPSSPKSSNWKLFKNASNASAEIFASVDDHFAKALGDTWKKLQESKEIRK